MSRTRLRTPAIQPAVPTPAQPLATDPSPQVVAHFEHVWRTSMHDMPFVNDALSVEALGFQRYEGDWLGVVITPWFINLFLLPGGGSLWRDLPTGEHGAVALPVGDLEFIGDNPGTTAAVAAYQYCPLLSPVQQVENQAQARTIARDALAAVFTPPVIEGGAPATGSDVSTPALGGAARPAGGAGVPSSDVASPARRGFLRAFGGPRLG